MPQLDRITKDDCTLAGFPIPAGTTLFLSIFIAIKEIYKVRQERSRGKEEEGKEREMVQRN